ncbi:MAG: hypothetical protein WEB87_04555, partial [Bacteriovoracaceae bacterium]
MFSKKYVFETRYTRSKRMARNIFLSLGAFCLACALLTIYLPIYAQKQNEMSKEAFYQKSPDMIVAFTVDAGRI